MRPAELLPAAALLAWGAAGGLAAALLWDLLERRRALRRASAQASLGPPRQAWAERRRELRAWLAERVAKGLPTFLRLGLEARLKAQGGAEPGLFLLQSLGWGLGGAALGLALSSPTLSLLLAGMAALPALKLREASRRRLEALRRALPEALDLLTACVQAGLGLDTAMQQSVEQLPPGPLRQEWGLCLAELRSGAPRRQAFAQLEARSALPELGSLLRAVLRCEAQGAPLGPTLKAQAAQLRRMSSLRLQAQAARAPVKLLLPLMAFFLPVIFLLLFGPILLQLPALGLE